MMEFIFSKFKDYNVTKTQTPSQVFKKIFSTF